MFGGPGKWIYNYVGGIDQAASSIGFEHVVLTPPATLIEQAIANPVFGPNATISPPLKFATASYKTLRGVIAMAWSLPQHPSGSGGTCGSAKEGQVIDLACPGSTVASVAFADYGEASGTCAGGFAKNSKCATNGTLDAFVGKCCVGKAACAVSCSEASCTCTTSGASLRVGDPCYDQVKKLNVAVKCQAKPPHPTGPALAMDVTIPPGSDSQLVVPLLGSSPGDVTITENGTTIYTNKQFVPGAVPGVTGATSDMAQGAVLVSFGSGSYSFVRSG